MRPMIAKLAIAVVFASVLLVNAGASSADARSHSARSHKELRSRLTTCATKLATAKKNLATAREALATAKTDLAGLRSNLATAKADLAAVRSDLATANTNLTSVRSQLATANTDLTTVRGQLATANASIAAKDLRIAELEALLEGSPTPPTPPAPPATSMQYGVSATSGSFTTEYRRQVAESEATVGYYYGQDPRWSNVADVPSDHDLWMQTKATTKAAYVAMLATFPATRSGKVFLHYHNEPEDQIERGDFTLAQWQQRTDWLYEAIAESGKKYVIPSIEIMYWDLQQTNKGTAGPARLIGNYLRPGVKAVGMSAYAEKKLKDGHEVASTSPTQMPKVIQTWSEKVNLPVSIITGWAVDTALLNDPVSLNNRVQWTKTAAASLAAAGMKHMMWFDIPWSNGDYRLSSDPNLLGAWRAMAP